MPGIHIGYTSPLCEAIVKSGVPLLPDTEERERVRHNRFVTKFAREHRTNVYKLTHANPALLEECKQAEIAEIEQMEGTSLENIVQSGHNKYNRRSRHDLKTNRRPPEKTA